MLLLGVTTFGPRMHERYFFPALLLLLAVYCLGGGGAFVGVYVLASTFGYFNMLFVLSMYYTHDYAHMITSPVILLLSALTVFTTVIAWLYVIRTKGEIPLRE